MSTSANQLNTDTIDQNSHLAHEERANKLKAFTAATVAIGALALSACTPNVGAEPGRPDTSSVSEKATPTTEENVDSPLDIAREELDMFKVKSRPGLKEFSLDPNKNLATKEAKEYLEQKHSVYALVNFTGLPLSDIKQFGNDVSAELEEVTHGTFSVQFEVMNASDAAKQLYEEKNQGGLFNQMEDKNYGSVIAKATMDQISTDQGVLALTDGHINSKNPTFGSAVDEGSYADVTDFTKYFEPILSNSGSNIKKDGSELRDPRDVALHELLHAQADVQHAMSIQNENGDLGGSFPIEPGAKQQVDLAEFLKSARVDEYGDYNIMGQTTLIGETPALTTTQLYTLEAAERTLGLPRIIKDTDLNETGTVTYSSANTDNAISIFTPSDTIAANNTGVNGLTSIYKLALAPKFDEEAGTWTVSIDGIALDNGVINFAHLSFFTDGGAQEKTIALPDGQTIHIAVNDTKNLSITAQ